MARLHLTVEGPTEQAFAAQLLRPHLVASGVYVGRIELVAHAKDRRGGLLKYGPFRDDIIRRLKEDKSSDAFFSTMIDLYKLPSASSRIEAARSERDPYIRVKRMEQALAEDIGDRRFVPYIQLHEFEAMLLAMPDAILKYYDGCKKEVAKLNQLVADFGSPELVDDGENTAPSKRIASLISDYKYAKHTAGPYIAAAIGLPVIRQKCSHFNDWIQQLEALGQNPI